MRRLLSGMAVMVALVTLVSAAGASECFMKMKQVNWRTSLGATTTVGGGFDSLMISNAGTNVVDTTAAINLSDYCYDMFAGSLSANTVPLLRVYAVSKNVGTITAGDSLAWAIDASADGGTNWYGIVGWTGMVLRTESTGYYKTLPWCINSLAGAGEALSAYTGVYQRFIRIRFKVISAHTVLSTKLFVHYPALRLNQ